MQKRTLVIPIVAAAFALAISANTQAGTYQINSLTASFENVSYDITTFTTTAAGIDSNTDQAYMYAHDGLHGNGGGSHSGGGGATCNLVWSWTIQYVPSGQGDTPSGSYTLTAPYRWQAFASADAVEDTGGGPLGGSHGQSQCSTAAPYPGPAVTASGSFSGKPFEYDDWSGYMNQLGVDGPWSYPSGTAYQTTFQFSLVNGQWIGTAQVTDNYPSFSGTWSIYTLGDFTIGWTGAVCEQTNVSQISGAGGGTENFPSWPS